MIVFLGGCAVVLLGYSVHRLFGLARRAARNRRRRRARLELGKLLGNRRRS